MPKFSYDEQTDEEELKKLQAELKTLTDPDEIRRWKGAIQDLKFRIKHPRPVVTGINVRMK